MEIEMFDVVSGPICVDCMKTFDIKSEPGLTVFSCSCVRDKVLMDRDMVVVEELGEGYAQSLYVNGIFRWKGSIRSTIDEVEQLTKLGVFEEMDRVEFVKRMRELMKDGTVHSV